tara:strand:- start:585 stop:710 length:126 start_codon:yes stop_codon:yes gene_type:complete
MKKWLMAIGIGTTIIVGLELYLRIKDKKYWDEVEESVPWPK